MSDLDKIVKIKDKLNERLKSLNINIQVDASFVTMLILLQDLLKEENL